MYCDDRHTKEQKNLHQNVNKLLPRGGIMGENFTFFCVLVFIFAVS